MDRPGQANTSCITLLLSLIATALYISQARGAIVAVAVTGPGKMVSVPTGTHPRHGWTIMPWAFVHILGAFSLLLPFQLTAATYYYTGQPFTTFACTSGSATNCTSLLTTNNRIVGYITVTAAFPPLKLTSKPSIQSFFFTDGVNSIASTATDPGVALGTIAADSVFATDASGRITSGGLSVSATPSPALSNGVFDLVMAVHGELPGSGTTGGADLSIYDRRNAAIDNQIEFSTASNSSPGTWSSISMVDPVPDLLSGAQITQHATAFSDLTKGRPVQGLAADGVAQVVIRIPTSTANEPVHFSLASGQCNASACDDNYGRLYDPTNPTSTSSTVTSVPTAEGPMAFVAYRAPLDFVRADSASNAAEDSAASTRVVSVRFTSNTASDTFPILIVRPLVVLIHGLWDDPGHAWHDFARLISDSRFRTYQADYSNSVPLSSASPNVYSASQLANVRSNSLGFAYNAAQLQPEVRNRLTRFRAGDNRLGMPVASIQADFVGHSMGGNVARTMTTLTIPPFAPPETYLKGSMHKLITIGTPHLGSPLGHALLDPSSQAVNACVQQFLADHGNFSFLAVQIMGIAATVNGAVGDLTGDIDSKPLSVALKNLQSARISIPTAMVAGVMAQEQLNALDEGIISSCTELTLCPPAFLRQFCPESPITQKLTSQGWPTIVGPRTDAIVPLKSQVNGLSPIAPVTAVHSDGAINLGFRGPVELSDTPGVGMPQRVIDELNTSLSLGAGNGSFVCLPSGTALPCN